MNIKNNSQHDLSTYYELSTSHAPLILPAILRSRAPYLHFTGRETKV